MKNKNFLFFILLAAIVGFFFSPFLFQGKIPLPADALVGMYHPFRDFFKEQYPRGFPFKNFLITDPVRQQFPWRWLAIRDWHKGKLPLWNPYQLTGSPLLANFQSASLNPFNVILYFLPFNFGWGILILFQPLLAGWFLYLFLRHLKLGVWSSFLGGLSFAFSGFMIAWLEWGTLGQTILWLPLILLAIDKIIKNSLIWGFIFIFSLLSSFFAGHLQTTFYVILFSLIYLGWRVREVKEKRKFIYLFSICYFLFAIVTSVQWFPTLQLVQLSGRELDLDWHKPGWFLPWQHLVQFFAPDFFGNPTTLNYWGEWNYAEFVGFIGVVPLVLAFYAIFQPREKIVMFFSLLAFLFLSFALPTPWAKVVYQWRLPLLATSQPTRLIGMVGFCLSVLSAFGLEKLINGKGKIFKTLLLTAFTFGFIWFFALLGKVPEENLAVTRRNLVLPTGMLASLWILILVLPRLRLSKWVLVIGLLILTIFDLLRFGQKFTPFSSQEFIFPQTETIAFLQEKQKENPPFRIMAVDKRILPPNFASVYQLEDVSGYDPLYLLRFGEMIAALERGEPNISPPFGFNRMITPANFDTKIIDLMNVKYVLALEPLASEKLQMVFEEGETKIYENQQVLPRAFLVNDYQVAQNKQEAIARLMNEQTDLKKTVILEESLVDNLALTGVGQATISDYQDDQVVVETQTDGPALLVLTDAYYPNWQATVNGQQTKIYRADYHYRTVVVPEGEHEVIFSYKI